MPRKHGSESTERELILHLRINSKDVGEKSIFKKRSSKLSTAIFSDSPESDNECSNCVKKDKEIKRLKSKIKELNDIINEHSILTTGNELSEGNCEFVDLVTGEIKELKSTDKPCRWCTCEFKTQPWFLPDIYYEEKYYVHKNIFCSPECAATYNRDFISDYREDDRHSLLQGIYQQVYNTEEPLGYAPSDISVLTKYGGDMTPEKFRNTSRNKNRDSRVVMPPMIPIIPKIEHRLKQDNVKYNADDSKRNLVLFRTKPLPNAGNTLEQAGLITKIR
jgi:hypothetical protein